jgi:hypothetical protein
VHKRRSLALYLPGSLRRREQEEETHRGLTTHSGPSRENNVSPRGHGRDTRARLLESFVPTLDSSEDAADAGDVSRYAITVTNTKLFQLVAIFGCWTVVPSGFTSDYGDERGTRHREH